MILQKFEFSIHIDNLRTKICIYEKVGSVELHPLYFCQGATCYTDEVELDFIEHLLSNTNISHFIVYNYRGLEDGTTKTKSINHYRTKLLARDLHEIVQYIEKNFLKCQPKFSIAGYSFGGVVMQEYLDEFGPLKIRSLVYILSLCFRCCRLSYKKLISYAFRYKNYQKKEDEKHNQNIQENFQMEKKNDNDYFEKKKIKDKLLVYQSLSMILDRIFTRNDCIFQKYKFSIPILYITAEKDEIFNFDRQKDCLQLHYPKHLLTHIHLQDSEHNIFWKNPKEISAHLIPFFNKIY
jgi:pimeloyl-ACP methyl ester carboxylesterase